MSRTSKCFLLFLSIAVAGGADKDQGAKFEPGPASSFTARQTISNLTIGARVIETDDQARPAFGKLNPYKFGILPILVVMQNDGRTTLSLEHVKVDYVAPNRERIEATPAADVKYVNGPEKPKLVSGPIPRVPGMNVKKNPLAAWEIEGRAFAAKMLPSGHSASGFFYFQTGHRSGSTLYVTGIREASTGKELFYFEVPLDKVAN